MLAQGKALGFGTHQWLCALKGRKELLRPFRAVDGIGHETRGVAPGWHPPRRWRDNAAKHHSITQATWVIEFASRRDCP
jgi:hypothetical protein